MVKVDASGACVGMYLQVDNIEGKGGGSNDDACGWGKRILGYLGLHCNSCIVGLGVQVVWLEGIWRAVYNWDITTVHFEPVKYASHFT